MYCYDMDGNLVWKKDLGKLDWGYFRMAAAQWGGGSSPVIHKRMVIIQCDVQRDSFLAAFSVKDGAQIWKMPRNDIPTWGTPTVCAGSGHSQIIVNGYRHIGGYDIETGKEIWRLRGGGDIPVPTPIVAHHLTYVTNARGGMSPIYAVRLSATGDIYVVRAGPEFKLLAVNKMNETCMATPAISQGTLFFRTRHHLVAVARDKL